MCIIEEIRNIYDYVIESQLGVVEIGEEMEYADDCPAGHIPNSLSASDQKFCFTEFRVKTPATKNFATATERSVFEAKHLFGVTKYFCCPIFNQ